MMITWNMKYDIDSIIVQTPGKIGRQIRHSFCPTIIYSSLTKNLISEVKIDTGPPVIADNVESYTCSSAG